MDKTQERAERYAQCQPIVQEWAEKCGHENLKGRIEVGGLIAAQAATTMTILLAGVGGSLAYAIRLLDGNPTAVAHGAAVGCVFLAALAVLLIAKCVSLADAPAVYNEPNNLLLPGAELVALRAGELANLQSRIDTMKSRNSERARWLNAIRMAALLTPLIFVLVVLRYR